MFRIVRNITVFVYWEIENLGHFKTNFRVEPRFSSWMEGVNDDLL